MIEGGAGYADPARLGQSLQARGDVDPVSIDVASINNDVSEVYADAKPELLCFGHTVISAGHAPLDRGGALDRVYDTREFD